MFNQFLIIAVLSLVITYVLFTLLKASAEGKGSVWGTSVTFGGSLAGFVIVFTLLAESYSRFFASEEKTTDTNITGNWELKMHSEGGNTEIGYATIEQQEGSTNFEIFAQIRDADNQLITFSTEIADMKDHRAIYVYKTNIGEMGVAIGDIPRTNPRAFSVAYYDIAGTDKNNNSEGTLTYVKVDDEGDWQKVIESLRVDE